MDKHNMIEHFQKFDGWGKNLLPLSFSQLNEFALNDMRRRIQSSQEDTSL